MINNKVTLNDLLLSGERTVRSIFGEVAKKKDKDFVLLQMCIGTNKYNEPFMCPIQWGSDRERVEKLHQLRINLAVQEVTDYVIISEAWSATALPGETKENHIQPRHREDRKEVVMIVGASRDGTRCGKIFAVERDGDGVPSLGALMENMPADIGGDLVHLFDDLPDAPPEVIKSFRNIVNGIRSNGAEGSPDFVPVDISTIIGNGGPRHSVH